MACRALAVVGLGEEGIAKPVKVSVHSSERHGHRLRVGQHVNVDAIAVARPHEIRNVPPRLGARREGELRRVGRAREDPWDGEHCEARDSNVRPSANEPLSRRAGWTPEYGR